MTDTHVVWHQHSVSREDRAKLNKHPGTVIWFTGLSGSGKSTVANVLDQKLFAMGCHTFLLDGDNVRHSLNPSPELLKSQFGEAFASRFGLSFGAEDRQENIRRIGAVAELFASAGLITLTAFVSPYRADRDLVRKQVEATGGAGSFLEIFVDAPLEVCESRDPKGLYKQARAGKIKNFTGISDPYEAPLKPELHLAAGTQTPDVLADQVLAFLRQSGRIT
ncbi:MAG: adenylyl-sulfate kinase [Planctomycetaceae bacterium]